MNRVEQLLRFLWDFVIGDDWRIALGVAVGLVVTLVLSNNGVTSWWLLPVAVLAMLSVSVWGVARSARRKS
jgi:hypothetical protein